MKILEISIRHFGRFHHAGFQFGPHINIIYGKNGSGKSTLHAFIQAMLFGMERGRGRAAHADVYSRYLPWESSGDYGGALRLEQEYGVQCRCGLHCAPLAHRALGTYPQGTVRFAFGYGNTEDEVDRCLEALRAMTAK